MGWRVGIEHFDCTNDCSLMDAVVLDDRLHKIIACQTTQGQAESEILVVCVVAVNEALIGALDCVSLSLLHTMTEPIYAHLYKDEQRCLIDLAPLVYDEWNCDDLKDNQANEQWLALVRHAGTQMGDKPIAAKTRKPFQPGDMVSFLNTSPFTFSSISERRSDHGSPFCQREGSHCTRAFPTRRRSHDSALEALQTWGGTLCFAVAQ